MKEMTTSPKSPRDLFEEARALRATHYERARLVFFEAVSAVDPEDTKAIERSLSAAADREWRAETREHVLRILADKPYASTGVKRANFERVYEFLLRLSDHEPDVAWGVLFSRLHRVSSHLGMSGEETLDPVLKIMGERSYESLGRDVWRKIFVAYMGMRFEHYDAGPSTSTTSVGGRSRVFPDFSGDGGRQNFGRVFGCMLRDNRDLRHHLFQYLASRYESIPASFGAFAIALARQVQELDELEMEDNSIFDVLGVAPNGEAVDVLIRELDLTTSALERLRSIPASRELALSPIGIDAGIGFGKDPKHAAFYRLASVLRSLAKKGVRLPDGSAERVFLPFMALYGAYHSYQYELGRVIHPLGLLDPATTVTLWHEETGKELPTDSSLPPYSPEGIMASLRWLVACEAENEAQKRERAKRYWNQWHEDDHRKGIDWREKALHRLRLVAWWERHLDERVGGALAWISHRSSTELTDLKRSWEKYFSEDPRIRLEIGRIASSSMPRRAGSRRLARAILQFLKNP